MKGGQQAEKKPTEINLKRLPVNSDFIWMRKQTHTEESLKKKLEDKNIKNPAKALDYYNRGQIYLALAKITEKLADRMEYLNLAQQDCTTASKEIIKTNVKIIYNPILPKVNTDLNDSFPPEQFLCFALDQSDIYFLRKTNNDIILGKKLNIMVLKDALLHEKRYHINGFFLKFWYESLCLWTCSDPSYAFAIDQCINNLNFFDESIIHHAYHALGRLHTRKKDYHEAWKYFNKAQHAIEEMSYGEYGITLEKLNKDDQKALEYLELAIKPENKYLSQQDLPAIYSSLIKVHLKNKNYTWKSFQWYEQKELCDLKLPAVAYLNLARVQRVLGMEKEALLSENNAKLYADIECTDPDQIKFFIYAYSEYAVFSVENQQDPEVSLKYLNLAVELCQKIQFMDADVLTFIYKYRAQLYLKQKDYQAALHNYMAIQENKKIFNKIDYLNFAEAYEALGKKEEAQDKINQAKSAEEYSCQIVKYHGLTQVLNDPELTQESALKLSLWANKLTLECSSYLAYFNQGKTYLHLAKKSLEKNEITQCIDIAIEKIEKALKLVPPHILDPWVYLNYAAALFIKDCKANEKAVLLKLKAPIEAIKIYQPYIMDDYLIDCIQCFLKLDDTKVMAKSLCAFATEHTQNDLIYFLWGAIECMDGIATKEKQHYSNACKKFEIALDLGEITNVNLRHIGLYGVALQKLGKNEKALHYLNICLKKIKDYYATDIYFTSRALLYIKKNDYLLALKDMCKISEAHFFSELLQYVNIKNSEKISRPSGFLEQKKITKEEIVYCLSALQEGNKKAGIVYYKLALIYEQEKNLEMAKACYRLGLTCEHRLSAMALGKLQEHEKDFENAWFSYTKALEFGEDVAFYNLYYLFNQKQLSPKLNNAYLKYYAGKEMLYNALPERQQKQLPIINLPLSSQYQKIGIFKRVESKTDLKEMIYYNPRFSEFSGKTIGDGADALDLAPLRRNPQ